MIGEALDNGKATDNKMHGGVLDTKSKSTKVEEYAVLRLVRMGYSEEEALQLLESSHV